MPNNPIKVKQLYRELRGSFDESVPSGEILRLAAAILETHINENKPDESENYSGRRPFHEYPLSDAFADGGWKVMSEEASWVSSLFEDEPHRPTDWKFIQSCQMRAGL
jgi:hypothetical protein